MPAASVNSARSEVLTGLPSEVRSSLETARVMASPVLTSAAVVLTTATERRAKSGDTGLFACRYVIHASRSIRPESLVFGAVREDPEVVAALARKLNVPIR